MRCSRSTFSGSSDQLHVNVQLIDADRAASLGRATGSTPSPTCSKSSEYVSVDTCTLTEDVRSPTQ